MASGIDIEGKPEHIVAGLIRAQQELQIISLMRTVLEAKALAHDSEGFKKTVDEIVALIYCQNKEENMTKSIEEQLEELGKFVVQIDPSTIPVAQDRLIPRKK